MIQLKLGSIFDEKCDLLIIPCNSEGGVTRWVFDNLKTNGIQGPKNSIPFGKVQYIETRLSLENAEFVGFAASVEATNNNSNIEAIESISEDIISFSISKKLRKINLPLLGTGAGKLSSLSVFKSYIEKFSSRNSESLEFIIYTPSREVYNNLKSGFEANTDKVNGNKTKNPRVFISYAGDDKDNALWVKNLVVKLRKNGIDARIDAFHLKPGVDLPQWMTNELILADKVILICDYNYMIKADIRKGGVGWETMIIQGDMLSQGDSKTKYIALIREKSVDKALPIYMKSKLAVNWGKNPEISDADFEQLVLSLFDCDIEPELGPIPQYVKDKLKNST
ncbi:MAG TPA: toll/interleukin-1 receptor domain-containing protein [Bacteroidales bacterium]|nr:toll/interleukin-1 receptor domain-containing protein [Bacteroidales bacterium]